MLIILGSLTMKPDLVEEVKPILADIRSKTLKEEGCIGYEGHISLEDPAKFVFIERWATESAFQAHVKQPHVLAWRQISHKYLAARDVDVVYVDRMEKLAAPPQGTAAAEQP